MSDDENLEAGDDIEVRTLTAADLEDVIRIDAASSGAGPRADYFRNKLQRALDDGSVHMSLAAVVDGRVTGFLMGSVVCGDYGVPEPAATIDALAVHPRFARKGVAHALWNQFARNLKGIRIDRVQTQVDWDQWEIMTFFKHLGFAPSPRVCIERRIDFESDG